MAKEIFEIDPNMLKEHDKASALIPGMSEKEWGDFFENVMQVGIRQPLDINTSYEVLDGRHRLKAARKLGLNTVKVIQHDFTPDEEMKFVRDTAIERRNITVEQKINVILNAEELIKTIYEEGKRKADDGRNKGRKSRWENGLSSFEEKPKKPHNSVEQIAKMAGTSPIQVSRAKKIKREDPQAFEEVVAGKKTVYKAYYDLPTVKKPKVKNERGDTDVKKEELPSVVKKRMKKQANPDLSESEIKQQMFKANVSTFFRHLSELEGFVGRVENLQEVVSESVKQDEASINDYANALKKIITLLEEN